LSAINIGDVAANSAVQISFNTYNSSGASANRTTAGTVKIYKDGSTTERTSTAGIVDNGTTGYDSITGLNLVTIDLSDNTDAGFYAAGHNYHVMVSGAVVDSQTVNPWIGEFSIQNRPVYVSPGTGTGQINLSSGNVPIQAGTGTGQLDFTSGVVKANLVQILATALTETAGNLAAGFKKWFNVNAPTSTMNQVTLVDTTTVATTATNLTNAPTNGDFTTTMKTSLNAATPSTTVSGWAAGAVQAFFDSVVTFNAAGSVGKLWNDILTKFHFTGSVGVEKVNSNAASEVLDALAADHNTANTIGALINLITGGVASAAAVWNYLVSSAGTDITKMGGFITVYLAAIRTALSAASVTVTSPVVSSRSIQLTCGDDYYFDDSRQIGFTYTGIVGTVTSALMRFTALGGTSSVNIGTSDTPVYSLDAVIVSASGTISIYFEMSSAQSARLTPDNMRFEVQLTMSDGHVETPSPLKLNTATIYAQAHP